MLWARKPLSMRVARRRPHVVALARAGHPPAADLDRLRGIAHVDAAIELVVGRIGRLEVARAGRAMDVFAVAEPELMHAARGRPRAVEERDRLRILRLRNVEQLEAGRLQILLRGLVGDRHHVAAGLERVRAHVGVRQIGLADDLGLARVGDVDGGEILRRALVRQPDDAASVRRDLHRHAFAHAAEAREHVVGQQLEIPGHGLIALLQRALVGGGHTGLLLGTRRHARPRAGHPRLHLIANIQDVDGRDKPGHDDEAEFLRSRKSAGYHAPARAFSIKSGRSALLQSGMALIFFSRSRISACSCM